MKCNCGYTAKGSICDVCDSVVFAEPEKVKVKKVRKPIKKVSDRRKAQNAEYKKLRVQFLLENPQCCVYPELKATEVHHEAGRIEDLLCDMSKWKPVSRRGHLKIEMEPEWAKANGFSLERLKTTI